MKNTSPRFTTFDIIHGDQLQFSLTPSPILCHSRYKNWLKFFNERVALIVYLITAAGYVLTANYALSNGSKSLPLRPFFWTLVIETLFLITLRVMDDLKDVDTVRCREYFEAKQVQVVSPLFGFEVAH